MSAGFEYPKIGEADGVEIISLVDNSIDFLSIIEQKEVRSFRQWAKSQGGFPRAEHGFSMLIRILSNGKSNSILFDTGCSPDGVIKNSKELGINLKEIEAIVLSHGHYDHFGGLLPVLEAIGKSNLPVIVHEEMFKIRGAGNQDAVHSYPSFPKKEQLSMAKLVYTKQPQLFINDMLLVTGEIPRETSFEKGFQQHKSLENGLWKSDSWVLDDRAIAVLVKGKGLVVVSGCAHAGIINTIRYAQKITAAQEVYAVLGGFHLAGRENETRIEQTVKELKQINPKRIAPSHCTGWRGKLAIANALPNAFINSSVGNLYCF